MDIAQPDHSRLLRPTGIGDWLFALVLAGAAVFALRQYGGFMDVYDKGILLLVVPGLAAIGWAWKPFRAFLAAAAGSPWPASRSTRVTWPGPSRCSSSNT